MIDNIIFTSTDNNINNIFENYKFEYELFLIESNTFNTFGKIDNQIIQESYDDLEILQESIKETLTVWIARFTEAVQKALDRFIQIIEGVQDLAYLRSIEGKVKALDQDPGFSVNNIRNYDDEALANFNVVEFNEVYQSDKDSLQSQDAFLIKKYSNLGFAEGKTDIKEVIENYMVQVVTNSVNVTPGLIKGYYNWCRNDYKNDLGKIRTLMNTYNESTKAISTIINNLPNDYKDKEQTEGNDLVTPKTNPENVKESFRFLLEAPGDPPQTQQSISNTPSATDKPKDNGNPAKMTFDDRTDYVAKAKLGQDSNQEVVNAIRTYLSVTTRILSTIFIIIKNRKADYMRVLKHLFPMNRQQRETSQSTVNINKIPQNQIDTSNIPTNNT